MSSSEIARLRLQMEEVCQAMQQGLMGYAITARHEVISHQYQQLDTYVAQLELLIGPEEAKRIICETYSTTIESNE